MAHKRGRERWKDWFPRKITIPKADDRCSSCGRLRGQKPRNSCCSKPWHNIDTCWKCKGPGKPRIHENGATGIFCDICWNYRLLTKEIRIKEIESRKED